MKKLLLLTLLTITSTYASETFELSTEVATCFVFTADAVQSGSDQIEAKAIKKCHSLFEKSYPHHESYLQVHSLESRNLCGGIKVSRKYSCIESK